MTVKTPDVVTFAALLVLTGCRSPKPAKENGPRYDAKASGDGSNERQSPRGFSRGHPVGGGDLRELRFDTVPSKVSNAGPRGLTVRTKSSGGARSPQTDTAAQRDAKKTDEERMKDVLKIARIIERYKAHRGSYPFAENWRNVPDGRAAIPVGVFVSRRPLPEHYAYPPPGVSGTVIPCSLFVDYLERVLGEGVDLPEDGLHAGHWVPYQVWFYEKDYFVSCHLTKPNAHTRPVGPAHKYQIGSMSVPSKKIRTLSEIGDE